MENKVKKEKNFLLNELARLLPEHFPPGIPPFIQSIKELSDQLNRCEDEIHKAYKTGTLSELKAAIRGYWHLHNKALKQYMQTKAFIKEIPVMPLSELFKRNLALQVYSEVLKAEVWFCSNTEMVDQIKKDIPEAVCYTVQELRRLLQINASVEMIQRIHSVINTFPGSTIIETTKAAEGVQSESL